MSCAVAVLASLWTNTLSFCQVANRNVRLVFHVTARVVSSCEFKRLLCVVQLLTTELNIETRPQIQYTVQNERDSPGYLLY